MQPRKKLNADTNYKNGRTQRYIYFINQSRNRALNSTDSDTVNRVSMGLYKRLSFYKQNKDIIKQLSIVNFPLKLSRLFSHNEQKHINVTKTFFSMRSLYSIYLYYFEYSPLFSVMISLLLELVSFLRMRSDPLHE